MNKQKIEKLIYDLILQLGENPKRDGLKETPKRVASMLCEFFKKESSEKLVKIFKEDFSINSPIEIKNIPFCSLCEHHMLPFKGLAYIKYVPKQNFLIGLSKFARIVNYFSKGLQLQERITNNVADFIYLKFPVKSVEVILEAEHLSMTLRGTKSIGSTTKTTAIRSETLNDINTDRNT